MTKKSEKKKIVKVTKKTKEKKMDEKIKNEIIQSLRATFEMMSGDLANARDEWGDGPDIPQSEVIEIVLDRVCDGLGSQFSRRGQVSEEAQAVWKKIAFTDEAVKIAKEAFPHSVYC